MQSPQHNISSGDQIFHAPSYSDFPELLPPTDSAPPKRCRIRKPQASGVYLFTPANLVIPDDYKDVENEIRYYLHVIFTSVNNRKHEIDGWARINRMLMRSIVGDAGKETKARAWLLENQIMGTEFSYSSAKHVSNSYYLHPDYEDHVKRWETTKKRLAYKLRLMRSLRFDDNSLRNLDEATAWAELTTDEQWVYQQLAQGCSYLQIDLDACRKTLRKLNKKEHDITMATAELIGTDDADYKADDYLRFHSPLTRLYTPLRSHLTYDGQKLVNVDIRNSQVVFFLKVMKEYMLHRWIEADDRRIEKEAQRQSRDLISNGSTLLLDGSTVSFLRSAGEKKRDDVPSSAGAKLLSVGAMDSSSNGNKSSGIYKSIVGNSDYNQLGETSLFCFNLYHELHGILPFNFPTTSPPRHLSLCCRNKSPVGVDVEPFTQLVEEGRIYDFILNEIKVRKDDSLEVGLVARLNGKAKQAIWKMRYRAFCCEHPVQTADEARRRKEAYARTHRVKDIEMEPIIELTRDNLKRLFFADIFYGRVQIDTPLTRLFAQIFPSVYHLILYCKRERYQDLARMMQKEEAKFILHTVCRRLFTYHKEVPVFTIHDSIMTTEEHVPLVKRIITEEFDRIGLHPTLKED